MQGPSLTAPISSELCEDESLLGQDKHQDREIVPLIGQSSAKEDIKHGDTSLVDLCEQIVEDVARRMRYSETILSPSIERKGFWGGQDGVHDDGHGKDDDFSIIVFDAHSSDNFTVRNHTELRTILENLLSNAVKFTQSGYCVRLSLSLDPEHCRLNIIGCGRGFSADFISHSLFVPFSQQLPVDNGVGLGLSLVKRNVDILEGSINLETDETLGSTVAVKLPIPSLTGNEEQRSQNNLNGQDDTATIPLVHERDQSELPLLKASLYVPKWLGRNDKRGERSIRLLHESLAKTFSAWFQPSMTLWREGQDEDLPHIVFIAQDDLGTFQEASRQAFSGVKKVVVCADIGKDSGLDESRIRAASKAADAIITGSILPSKLWKVMTLLFPQAGLSKGNQSRDHGLERVDAEPQAETDDIGSQPISTTDDIHVDHNYEEWSAERSAIPSAPPALDQNLPGEEENAASVETPGAGADVRVNHSHIPSEDDPQNATNAAKHSGYTDQEDSGPSIDYVIRTSRPSCPSCNRPNPDSKPPAQCKILLVDDSK